MRTSRRRNWPPRSSCAPVPGDGHGQRMSLSRDELERLVAAGEVDTVIVAFSDMLGRLMGKRVSGRFFIDEVVESGAECCNYLFAVDVEMNTVEGYAMAGWGSGYGDMVMRPDLSTLRRGARVGEQAVWVTRIM